jgi:hypothetical protein
MFLAGHGVWKIARLHRVSTREVEQQIRERLFQGEQIVDERRVA